MFMHLFIVCVCLYSVFFSFINTNETTIKEKKSKAIFVVNNNSEHRSHSNMESTGVCKEQTISQKGQIPLSRVTQQTYVQ